ncbi:hypothetical protein GCM10010431_74250 [Streptomyces kunmingensis]
MAPDIRIIGRYVSIPAPPAGTDSAITGGSCITISPLGISGPRRLAVLRKKTTLNGTSPSNCCVG